jgi:hypothetical protein
LQPAQRLPKNFLLPLFFQVLFLLKFFLTKTWSVTRMWVSFLLSVITVLTGIISQDFWRGTCRSSQGNWMSWLNILQAWVRAIYCMSTWAIAVGCTYSSTWKVPQQTSPGLFGTLGSIFHGTSRYTPAPTQNTDVIWAEMTQKRGGGSRTMSQLQTWPLSPISFPIKLTWLII